MRLAIMAADFTPDVDALAVNDGQAAVTDYQAVGMTLGKHPLALVRRQLAGMGCVSTQELVATKAGRLLEVGGLVLMRQRPGTSKGIVFVTMEDEFGTVNLVIYANIATRNRAALLSGRLLIAEGRVERTARRLGWSSKARFASPSGRRIIT